MIPQKYFTLVHEFFDKNPTKTYEWFQTIHPLFAGKTPLEMIKTDQAKKLMRYIDQQTQKRNGHL